MQILSYLKNERLFQRNVHSFRENSVITFRADLQHKNGTKIPVEISGKVVELDGKLMGQGTIRDIRQRIETQQKLVSSENIFKAIWDNSKDGMRLTDQDGIMVLCNNAFAQLFEKSIDELVGRPISDLYFEEKQEVAIAKYKQNFIQGMVKDYLESSAILWNGKRLFSKYQIQLLKIWMRKDFYSVFLEI